VSDLIAWVIIIPTAGAVLTALARGQNAVGIGLAAAVATAAAAGGLLVAVATGGPVTHAVGGWPAPLGIGLFADGLAVLMVTLTAVVGLAVTVYASAYFPHRDAGGGFAPVWLLLWGGMNALYLSADLFNLYVTLEVVTLAAVVLVIVAGERATVAPALRYLVAATLGATVYLLGVGYLYAETGVLSLEMAAAQLQPGPAAAAGVTLLTAGLLVKAALFPLHFWLPPAHASAPAPASAILSALVVKAAFYTVVRLWLFVMDGLPLAAGAQVLGILGVAAMLYGSVLALRQRRLKMLIAYSTVAQVGFLFLLFPLAVEMPAEIRQLALQGAIYGALAHGLAKAAMFLAAGSAMWAAGNDRLPGMRGLAVRLPVSIAAFAIGSVSLAGLPPSGGFVAKWLMLNSALLGGQWWWAVALAASGLLTAAYTFRVIAISISSPRPGATLLRVPRRMEGAALVLALLALLLGVWSAPILALLEQAVAATGGAP
jgi:formate hydrogenlyase subunit 3/multisubunit Na+/H+ antiporter MnhD subunit